MTWVRCAIVVALVGCASPKPPPSAEAFAPLPAAPLPAKPAAQERRELTYQPHPELDAALSSEYSALDAELASGFDYDTGHQRYAGHAEDLFGRVDQRSGTFEDIGGWRKALQERDRYAARLDHIIMAQPSLRLVLLALARRGSLSHSMLRGITTLDERGFTVLSHRQLATLSQAAASPSLGPAWAAGMKQEVLAGFAKEIASKTRLAAEQTVGAYAWALVIAHVYGGAEPIVDDLRARLVELRHSLGAEDFADMVEAAPPPEGYASPKIRLSIRDLRLPR